MAGSNNKHPSASVSSARETFPHKPNDAVVVQLRPGRTPPLATGALHIRWHLVEPRARYAIAADARGGQCLHLMAERLPNSTEWDWQVWQAWNAAPTSSYGTAPSVVEATAAAEAAARDWRGNDPGRVNRT